MATNKFKEMVHFIIDECRDPARLGATRLNKVCWHADLISFKVTGKSISGETYVKRQRGPVPSKILATLEKLKSEGAITIRERNFGYYKRRDFMSLRPCKIRLLSENDLDTIREVLGEVCNHSANIVSEMTHDQIWNAAGDGEEIPFFATLAASSGTISSDDKKWANQMVRELKREFLKEAV